MAQKSPTLMDKHVAGRMRLRRLQVGMSQEELAATLGITFQQVQKYEKGTNRITAGRLQEIARVLSVPLSFFYEDGPETGNTQVPEEAMRMAQLMTSPEVVSLMRALARFESPRIWKAVANLAIAIAEEADRSGSSGPGFTHRSG
jgi:transcriptional regulator with XRE-family HTH domain